MSEPTRREERTAQGSETVSPGAELRAAREAQGLAIEEVARRLRLDPRTVRLLEDDRTGDLPAPAYARGYLRSYARLLGLDAEPLLERLPLRHPGPAFAPVAAAGGGQARSGDRPVRLVTYLVVVLVLVLPAAWWWTEYGDALRPSALLRPEPAPTQVAPAPPAAAPAHGRGDVILQPSALGYAYAVVRHPDYAATAAEAPAPADTPAGPERAPGAPQDGRTETTATLDAAGDAGAAPPRPPGTGRVELDLAADAWIEIYDADGERLYYDLGRAAESIRVEGQPPLRLVIGNAGAVELRYNGARVELSAHNAEGVARLSVGE